MEPEGPDDPLRRAEELAEAMCDASRGGDAEGFRAARDRFFALREGQPSEIVSRMVEILRRRAAPLPATDRGREAARWRVHHLSEPDGTWARLVLWERDGALSLQIVEERPGAAALLSYRLEGAAPAKHHLDDPDELPRWTIPRLEMLLGRLAAEMPLRAERVAPET